MNRHIIIALIAKRYAGASILTMSKLPAHNKLDWQQELILAVNDPYELLRLVELDPSLIKLSTQALTKFPLKVPRGFVARMEKANPNDPLLRQVLPLAEEDLAVCGYSLDPLGEAAVNPVAGLLHKYHGRVLLTLTGTCAINCRYCFRRHFPYTENNPAQEWKNIFKYLAADPSISEVILSGGDPLILNDRTLANFSEELTKLPQITRLRIHSRIPVVLPERISPEFINWIATLKQKVIMVIHCNHPNEISPAVIKAMTNLKKAGVHLLNQSVLLKGINDNAETLTALSEALFSAGVLPYYLHLLDRVQGAAHFDLDLARIKKIYRALTHALPGYMVPKLVQEKSGEKAKVIIGSA